MPAVALPGLHTFNAFRLPVHPFTLQCPNVETRGAASDAAQHLQCWLQVVEEKFSNGSPPSHNDDMGAKNETATSTFDETNLYALSTFEQTVQKYEFFAIAGMEFDWNNLSKDAAQSGEHHGDAANNSGSNSSPDVHLTELSDRLNSVSLRFV